MMRSTFRNRMQGPACCTACASHMGDTSAGTGTFADFLAQNPDLAALTTQYQQANPADPVLQQILYNPLTNTMGPAPIPFTPSTPSGATSSTNWGIVTVMAAVAGIFLIDATLGSSGRRRR